MAADPTARLVDHIRSFAGVPEGDEPSDRRLLHDFATRGDAAAFETLVRRHGPMVLRVGRRVLPDAVDAEDVFQATFLLLARKASSVRWDESVANWLYGVAYRLAQKARDAAGRRAARERQAPARRGRDPLAEITGRELVHALDEEMLRLPEKYRAPLVLCYLEGLTRDEAARRLGCPLGTLKSRLERGRDLLGRALTRRGVAPGAALAACLAVPDRGSGAVPPALLHATLHVARTGPAGVAPSVRALVERARPAVAARMGVAAMLLAGLVTAGLAVPAPQGPPGGAPAAAAPPAASAGRATDALDDPLPKGAILRLGTLRFRHRGSLTSLAFSPDGKALVSAGGERFLRFWDPVTGRELRQVAGPDNGVWAVAFSPDGRMLACGSVQCVSLLDVETGKEIRRWGGYAGPVMALAFSPKCDRLAATDGRSVRVWETRGGQLLGASDFGEGSAGPVAFAADGRTVAVARQDNAVLVWDVEGGKLLHRLRGHGAPVHGLAFAPDGKTLVSTGEDATRLWDVTGGKPLKHPAGTDRPGGKAAFSPDGKKLALGSGDGIVRVRDEDTGKELWRADAHPYSVYTLAFSPDGKKLASGSGEASVRLWDVETGRSLDPATGHNQRICAVAYSADGRVIATAGWDGAVRLWDARNGQEVRRLEVDSAAARPIPLMIPRQLADLALSQGGDRIAAAGGDSAVRVWDVASGKEVHRFAGRCVAFAPDGKLIAAGGHSIDDAGVNAGVVRLYDATTGKEVRNLRGHLTEVFRLAFSPDGKTLVSVGLVLMGMRTGEPGESETKFVRCWDVATGRERPGAPDGVGPRAVTLSPDGKTLAVADDRRNAVSLWETATARSRARLPGQLAALAIAPDGRTLAVGDFDGIVHLYDLPSCQLVARFEGHHGWVHSLAFAPDGRTLVSAGFDTTALVWDVSRLRRPAATADLTAGELEASWKALAGDAEPAYAASAKLVAAPRRAVPFLRQRLRPAAMPDERQLARLIADLDSDSFNRREEATVALQTAGESVGPALRRALKDAPPEARRRLQALVAALDEGRLSADALRGLRCVEVLERIGDDEARRALEALAGGAPGARLTGEAKGTLQRLVRRTDLSP